MLDRSIEFHSIIMRNPNHSAPVLPEIPEGFSLRFYEEGDENDWAEIQVAVTEFPDKEAALKCYDYYWQYMDELKKDSFLSLTMLLEKRYRQLQHGIWRKKGSGSALFMDLAAFRNISRRDLEKLRQHI